MAKTLVALYDTFTDAERVVQELMEDGFTRSDIHLALDHTRGRAAQHASVERDSAYEGANPRRVEGDKEVTIPVVEEDITIGKREVERGHVRIFSRVTEQPVEESVRLREEKVTVERRPADRPATAADFAAAEQEAIEITETAEEPVVSKRARVVEEVVVHKEVTERTETVRGTERHTEVDVQRAPETSTQTRHVTAAQDFATYDPIFRKHYTTAFAGKGAAYTEYEPAYRYGYELSTNERYRGRDWAALEVDARRDWEARHPSTWERFKDAIRYGWDKVRART